MKTNLFFAIELAFDARVALDEFLRGWRAGLGERRDIAWYDSSDLHITLKFLGARDICEEGAFAVAAESVVEKLRVASASLGLTSLAIKPVGVGAFPSLARPRVLWAGAQATPELIRLAGLIDEACAELGTERETRTFKPHITLARRRVGLPIDAPEQVEKLFPEFAANQFVLMRTSSPLDRKNGNKLRYNPVRAFAFP